MHLFLLAILATGLTLAYELFIQRDDREMTRRNLCYPTGSVLSWSWKLAKTESNPGAKFVGEESSIQTQRCSYFPYDTYIYHKYENYLLSQHNQIQMRP